MTGSTLRMLPHAVGLRLDEGFLGGGTSLDVDDLVEDFRRDVSTDHLSEVLTETMRRFDYASREPRDAERRRAQADAWAAPRVHAALRLTRKEGAERGLWRYIGVVVAPEFIRWRFPGGNAEWSATPDVRFTGPDEKHAISRLWWGAELSRNGTDYSPVGTAFEVQNIADNLLRWRFAHNRVVTLAFLRYVSTYDRGELISSADVVKVGQSLNRAATTIQLDALAPAPSSDVSAYRRWLEEDIDEQAWFGDKLPAGPDDGQVGQERMDPVIELLCQLAPPMEPDEAG